MDQGPLAERIIAEFDGMSAQLKTAARYMLDHPSDVALLSMREQARQAGVQPATMTRLAKHLGFAGFDAVRESYAAAVRGGYPGFAGKAGIQVRSQKLKGDRAQASEMVDSIAAHIAWLARPDVLDRILAAARRLASARRIYCLGLRSSHPVAWHIHYVLSLFGDRSILLDGMAATGTDAISRATDADVLLAASVLPYTRQTVEIAEYAAGCGVPVVAITDSAVAPLAQIATEVILVPTQSPSFFHTMAPAFVVAEILAVILAGHGGEQALAEIRRTDEHHAALNVHLKPRLSTK